MVWTKTGKERWREIKESKSKSKNKKRKLARYYRAKGVNKKYWK